MNYVILFFRFLKNHIGKIIFTLVAAAVLIVFLFPFSDLNDFISSQVLKATQNQVYLQFDDLRLNPLGPSVHLTDVKVETPTIDNLSIKNLSGSPSLSALIARKPGGHILAEGVLGGDLDLKLSPDKNSKPEVPKSEISMTTQKISLKELSRVMNLSLPLSGNINATLHANIDLAFTEQPEGELSAQIQKFEMLSATVNLPDLGALNVPEIKLSQVELKSKFQNGKYTIENAKLGTASDDLNGTLKGDLDLSFRNMNGQIVPVIGTYNLSIDLVAKPAFKERALFFLNFIERFQSNDPAGTRYRFRLSSQTPGMPPQMLPLQ